MSAPAGGTGSRASRFTTAAVAVVVFAAFVRLLYVGMVHVEYPIRGDINQYVLYAWNLTHRGTFSSALPTTEVAPPDSYRPPAYPALLSTAMLLAGHSDLPLRPGPQGTMVLGYASDSWMQIVLLFQVFLGAATVWLAIALGRMWLGSAGALSVGLFVAFWPHLITFSGVLLSETLFAFSLAFALWLLCSAQSSGNRVRMTAAGLAWGLVYLVNPIVALFPFIVSPLLRRSGNRLAIVFLAASLLAPAAWAVRNAISVSTGSAALQRVAENFVQGSWPTFLTALNSRFNNDISRQIVEAVGEETREVQASPVEGLREIGERMADDPLYYAGWYALEKPYLLWDWGIRVGAGDIYFLPVEHSPFERIPILRLVRDFLRGLNPLFFVLATTACIGIVSAVLFRRLRPPFAPTVVSLLLLYLTSVHVLLQAEPRYSIPYRPEEILLAVSAMTYLARFLIGRLQFRRGSNPRDGASSEILAQSSADVREVINS